MEITKNAVYIIKDSFFNDFPDPYLKGNKDGNRPHYYCYKDDKSGLFWVIPMSLQVEKVRKIMEKKAAAKQPCDSLHILKIANKESAFIISDIFPITEEYIDRDYTINNIPLALKNDNDIRIIDKKAKKVLALLRKGHKFVSTQPDIFTIEQQLSANLSSPQVAAATLTSEVKK